MSSNGQINPKQDWRRVGARGLQVGSTGQITPKQNPGTNAPGFVRNNGNSYVLLGLAPEDFMNGHPPLLDALLQLAFHWAN